MNQKNPLEDHSLPLPDDSKKEEAVDYDRLAENLLKDSPLAIEGKAAPGMIDAGYGSIVADRINLFIKPDYNAVAQKLLEAGLGNDLANNIAFFRDLNSKVVDELLERGFGWAVAAFPGSLANVDCSALAIKLIEAGNAEDLAENLADYFNLSAEVAEKLIKERKGYPVLNNTASFAAPDLPAIALKLVQSGTRTALAQSLNLFKGADQNGIAKKLVEEGRTQVVAENIGNFYDIYDPAVLKALIESGYGEVVATSMNHFSLVNHAVIADYLIDAEKGKEVAKFLDRFQNFSEKTLNWMIKIRYFKHVIASLGKFEGVSQEAILDKIIAARGGEAVANHVLSFTELKPLDIFEKLLAAKDWRSVIKHIEKFGGQDDAVIADKISATITDPDYFKNEGLRMLAEFGGEFSGFSAGLAKKFFENGFTEAVAMNINKFTGLDQSEYVDKFFAEGRAQQVVENFEKFAAVDPLALAERLIKANYGHGLALSMENFERPERSAITLKLLEKGFGNVLVAGLKTAKNLDVNVALKLIELKGVSEVISHLEHFDLNTEDRLRLLDNLPLLNIDINIEQLGIDQSAISDPRLAAALALPKVGGLQEFLAKPEMLASLEGKTPQQKTDFFIDYCQKTEWPIDIRAWYLSLVDTCGNASAANNYLYYFCQKGGTIHDALFYIDPLKEEFSDDSSLAKIIADIKSHEDAENFSQYAAAYSRKGLEKLGTLPVPETLRDFIRACILIKKNFEFPANVSERVKEKITMILESVEDVAALSDDLAVDGRFIPLLENSDGLDEAALLQPIPEIGMRISPLGGILLNALGSREVNKLSGTAGQLQKEIGPLVLDLQRRALASEEQRLKEAHHETYALPNDNIELINLKKGHARFLESLKLVKGNNYGLTEDKSGTSKRLRRLVEGLPEYKDAGTADKIRIIYDSLAPLYEKLRSMLSKEKLGSSFATDPVLRYLIESVAKEGPAPALRKSEAESEVEFYDRVGVYMEDVVEGYLALTDKIQKVGNADALYRQIEKIIGKDDPDGARKKTNDFLKNPDAYLADNRELSEKIENLLLSLGINIGDKLVARVHAKSDARGMVSGDDTNCCMAYGTDKNYDYMYRRDTAYFTVSISHNGIEKTIAQSVLVAANSNDKDPWAQFDTIGFDNIEVAHAYEKQVPEIAQLYKQVISQYWPDKRIIMGTSHNDDRDLVRSMGQLVRNKYKPVEGSLDYSDCFDHDTVVLLRQPHGMDAESSRPHLNFVTPAMLEEDSPLAGQIAANFNLSRERLTELAAKLAPVNRLLYRDDDNDPIFEADNKSVQIHIAGKPVLFLLGLDFESPEYSPWEEIKVVEAIEAPGASSEEVMDALVAFLSLQPASGYTVAIPKNIFERHGLSFEELKERAEFVSVAIKEDACVFRGTEEEDGFDYDPYDDYYNGQ